MPLPKPTCPAWFVAMATALTLTLAAGCVESDQAPVDEATLDDVLGTVEQPVGSGSGSGSGGCTTPDPGQCPGGACYRGRQDTRGLSCPVRDACGNYGQRGVHCYAMKRPLGEYAWGPNVHAFTGCIGTGGADVPTARNTVGSVWEDSWVSPGLSGECWDVLVNGWHINTPSATECGNNGTAFGPIYKASIESDLGCYTGDLATAHAKAEAWAHAKCDYCPTCVDAPLVDAPDAMGATYPSFPHTYNAPWYGGGWGHGKAGCNCIQWSAQFRSKLTR